MGILFGEQILLGMIDRTQAIAQHYIRTLKGTLKEAQDEFAHAVEG